MAITIVWGTGEIQIPQSYLDPVVGTLYDLDTVAFRLVLKDFEDSEMGMAFPDTHIHNKPVSVAGTTYASFIEIISPYFCTFEDGAYSVRLIGSNNNIFDIENGILTQNQVQVIPTNSAGLIISESGVSGLTTAEAAMLDELYRAHALKDGEDLVVTPDSKTFGDVSQTIVKVGDEVTVSRDP
jgi:hypothetical protein